MDTQMMDVQSRAANVLFEKKTHFTIRGCLGQQQGENETEKGVISSLTLSICCQHMVADPVSKTPNSNAFYKSSAVFNKPPLHSTNFHRVWVKCPSQQPIVYAWVHFYNIVE